jgi:hypothetical protein
MLSCRPARGALVAAGLLAIAVISSATACLADEQDKIFPGDDVTVVADSVELGLRDKPAVTLSPGDKIHVTEVRDRWIGGYALRDGRRYTGWVRRDEVQLVVIEPDQVPSIEVPVTPDDPAAVATLREAGVQLELNDKGNVHAADATASKLTDAGMAAFHGLHQLATLDISDRPISDAGLQALGESKALQELYAGNTPLTDAGLVHLKQWPNLEVLSLQGTRVTGGGLEHLKQLPSLRVLNLSHCLIPDAALAHLEQLPKLEVVALNDTKITSAGLVHLQPLSQLRVLNVNGCDVDDQGLEQLVGLDELRMLYVAKTHVTQEGMDNLGEVAPSLAIFD